MKTITEFNSIVLKTANEKLQEILRTQPKPAAPEVTSETPSDNTNTEAEPALAAAAPEADASVAALENESNIELSTNSTDASSAGTPVDTHTAADSATTESASSDAAIAPQEALEGSQASKNKKKKFNPKSVQPRKPLLEILTDEVKQAFGAALKLEGQKLDFMVNAIDFSRRTRYGLKRVLVLSLDEKDKVPAGAQKVGDHYFLTELIPGLPQPSQDKKSRFGRGEGRGPGGKDKKRRGKGRSDRSNRQEIGLAKAKPSATMQIIAVTTEEIAALPAEHLEQRENRPLSYQEIQRQPLA